MDIENFTDEELKDELLKVIDELFNRGFNKNDVYEHISYGERL